MKLSVIMANLTNDGNETTFAESFCYKGVVDEKKTFILTLNIFISVAALLGNALIVAALPKVSSLHPSSKLLFKCLVWSDLSVGLFSEPFYIAFLLSPGPRFGHIQNVSFNKTVNKNVEGICSGKCDWGF